MTLIQVLTGIVRLLRELLCCGRTKQPDTEDAEPLDDEWEAWNQLDRFSPFSQNQWGVSHVKVL